MKKIKDTKVLSRADLIPLIKWCRKKTGRIAQVLVLYNEGLAKPIMRNTLDRWLIADDAKAAEPLHGAGLRLAAVWQQIQREEFNEQHELVITVMGLRTAGRCKCGWAEIVDGAGPTQNAYLNRQHAEHLTEEL